MPSLPTALAKLKRTSNRSSHNFFGSRDRVPDGALARLTRGIPSGSLRGYVAATARAGHSRIGALRLKLRQVG